MASVVVIIVNPTVNQPASAVADHLVQRPTVTETALTSTAPTITLVARPVAMDPVAGTVKLPSFLGATPFMDQLVFVCARAPFIDASTCTHTNAPF